MSSEHIETKHKIQDIAELETLQDLLDRSTLTEEDKQLIYLIYLKEETQVAISRKLGMSISTIKRKHAKILAKLNKLL